MAVTTEDWRSKYRSLALEVEQNQQAHDTAIEDMRRLVTQVDVAVHGQSPDLDQLLGTLAGDLQSGKLARVSELIRKTEPLVRQLDEARATHANELISRINDWVSFLSAEVTDQQAVELNSIRQRLVDEPETTQHLPEVIDRLVKLQKAHPGSDVRTMDSDDLSQQSDVIGSRLAKRLLELIQQLNIPAEHRASAHNLVKKLEANPDVTELEQCLEEASALARVSGGTIETEIQDYLLKLNDQLAYLRTFLDKTEESATKQLNRNNLLDQTVRHDVKKISLTVRNSNDLNELKAAVNEQLASLIKAVNNHKKQDNQHIEQLQKERKELLNRLDQMEQKADHFRQAAEEAHVKSHTDPLTGLPNRLGYDQQLSKEIEHYKRYGIAFSLCVLDIDLFKGINDKYGHMVGDKVLRLTAKVIRGCLRGSDFAARIGGEEFVVIMPSTSGDAARQAAEKIRKAIEKSPFNFQSNPVKITISIGLTGIRTDDTAGSLFGRADKYLYNAKHEGRNRVIGD
ncbi:MAG: hypothetical protein CMI01_05625 [Oceanospirillaceae bacterium]|nr:hypothetical protein [Oceanospirillaceae bacterium]